MELTLTLNRKLLREAATNIRQLIRTVPSARVLSGDPHVSARVFVEESHVEELQAAVRGACTVSELTELDLLGRR